MSDKVEPEGTGDAKTRLKRRLSLEASVTLGLGYGKKKKQNVEAFYTAVWPVLVGAGWSMAKGEGDDEGATYFLPPGITISKKGEGEEGTQQTATKLCDESPWDCASCGHTNGSVKHRCSGVNGEGSKCMAWRGGKRLRKPYFSKIRDVIERILEEKNEPEKMAADAYLAIVPDANDILIDPKDKKKEPSSPRRSQQSIDHSAWKDVERTHYEKSSSQVGPEFQVDALPAAGSYTSANKHPDALDGGALYDKAWDPAEAEKSGKLDFVHTRVKSNKKEAAYDLFHKRGYRLPGFYEEVRSLSPSDCSEWTKEDKDRFRAAVFEHHENMKEVSNAMGKPTSECITYYLVMFKRTKSYKSLKRSMKRKANVTEGSAGTLVCNQCGKGGMLIACDTCEAHYHLSCASPPLQSIPDGNWACGNCKRETRSMLSSQDDNSCGTDQRPSAEASIDVPMEGRECFAPHKPGNVSNLKTGSESATSKGLGNVDMEGLGKIELGSEGTALKGDVIMKGKGDAGKQKYDPEDASLQLLDDRIEFKPASKYTDEVSGSNHKRKYDSGAASTQEETVSSSEQADDSSSCKKRMGEASVETSLAVVPV